MVNEAQQEYWNGEVGRRWASQQVILDRMLAPIGEAAMDALQVSQGLSVIDVGCGCGTTSLALADRGGRVTGVDLSGPMLALARRHQRSDLRFVQGDMATLSLEELSHEDPFSRAFSRFGVMFFDDPIQAFSNLRRSLSAGGRLAFVCWRSVGENEWIREPLAIVQRFAPSPAAPPDPHAPGPFAFADGARVAEILSRAGFNDCNVSALDLPETVSEAGAEDAVRFMEHIGPASSLIGVLDAKTLQQLRVQLAERLSDYAVGENVILGSACWLVTASC